MFGTAVAQLASAIDEIATQLVRRPGEPGRRPRRQLLVVLHTTVDTLAETGDPTEWMLAVEQAWSSATSLGTAHLWSCDCWLAHAPSSAPT